ncbi:MAG TPA: carboxypeptidase-like regulatory domain-containing protein [Candidatus Acidoferrales bacterium]|nr:carboxypeptidase-like regulatory domain-containing protein [Candidatus Acidoferrales bacterium]
MRQLAAKGVHGFVVFLLGLFLTVSAFAQQTGQGISGTVTGPAAQAVANAKVSIKNVASGQITETATDAAGHYAVANLEPGDYEVSVSADGFALKTTKATVASGQALTVDIALAAAAESLPSAPKPQNAEPSLNDLGFPSSETRGSAEMQARLDKRSHLLQIHQKLGLITTAPLIATVISGAFAGGKSTSSTNRDIHAGLGALTVGLYTATAWYAIRAPKIEGTHTRGEIKFHKAMAWIHGPGMVLTPILGAMAFEQKSKGEKVHGIASLHSVVAIVTASAYGAGLMSVTLKF